MYSLEQNNFMNNERNRVFQVSILFDFIFNQNNIDFQPYNYDLFQLSQAAESFR